MAKKFISQNELVEHASDVREVAREGLTREDLTVLQPEDDTLKRFRSPNDWAQHNDPDHQRAA